MKKHLSSFRGLRPAGRPSIAVRTLAGASVLARDFNHAYVLPNFGRASCPFSTETSGASAGPSSGDDNSENVFTDPRPRILDAALNHVHEEGWSQEALAAGARDCGYPAVAQGMFQRGAVDLVFAFMRKGNIQMSLRLEQTDLAPLSVNERIATAVRYRLEYLAPFIKTWPQAMALGLLPPNVTETLTILSELVDEIWWHAGDRSTDLDWYSRRALLLGVYAATEAFMLQDRSPNHQDTWEFLNRRLAEVAVLGQRAGESLAVAQAAVGGATSIAAAAFEVIRPAVLTGGTALGTGINALQSALSQGRQGGQGGQGGGAPGANGPAAEKNPLNDLMSVGGLPLSTVLNAAAPAITAAAGVVEGVASRLNIQLPPLVQAFAMAVGGAAATGGSTASPFSGSGSSPSASPFASPSPSPSPSPSSAGANNNPFSSPTAAEVAAAAGLPPPPPPPSSSRMR